MADDKASFVAPHDHLQRLLEAHDGWLAQRSAKQQSTDLALALLTPGGEAGGPAQAYIYSPNPFAMAEGEEYVGKVLTHEEVNSVLTEHREWLASAGTRGRRARLMKSNLAALKREPTEIASPNFDSGISLVWAHLHGAGLNDTDLHKARFEWAHLDGAFLTLARLQGAVLRQAVLDGANLVGANVTSASFAGASLVGTDFTRAEGMRTLQLADVDFSRARGITAVAFEQLDTTGAKLPEDIHAFNLLPTVDDASKNARTVFQVMMAGCFYCGLTLLSVTDPQLLTNSGRLQLPILATEVALRPFFVVAPLLLLLSFVYLHLYLRHVWDGIAGLPAIFPDGKTISQRLSPWMLLALIDRHQSLAPFKARTRIARFQEMLALALGWWIVPLTIVAIAYRSLTHVSVPVTSFQLLVALISLFAAISFHTTMVQTLRGTTAAIVKRRGEPEENKREGWSRGSVAAFVICAIAMIGSAGILLLTIQGRMVIAPRLPQADFFVREERTKPSEINSARPLNLWAESLQGAQGNGALLVRANLERADLRFSHLRHADLHGANLRSATLDAADLTRANLRGAHLEYSSLRGAILVGADMRDAHGLTNAQLASACGDVATLLDGALSLPSCRSAELKP